MALHAARGKLIGVIGDEDTCVGFLLGGVGELNKNRQPNFLVVDKNTEIQEIEDTLKSFIRREDISIILINQNVAEEVDVDYLWNQKKSGDVKTFIPQVRHILDNHTSPVPAILEIPSKDSPYDPNKDSILRYILITAVCVFILCPRLFIMQLSVFRRAKGLFSADDLK